MCTPTVFATDSAPAASTIRLAMGPVSSQSIVTPFADRVLSADLPRLGSDRRYEVVAFIVRRIDTLPSITRIGVLAIAAVFRVVLLVVPGPLPMRVAGKIPICSEYLRLVRSLGYAYIWETWPSTTADGGTAAPAQNVALSQNDEPAP